MRGVYGGLEFYTESGVVETKKASCCECKTSKGISGSKEVSVRSVVSHSADGDGVGGGVFASCQRVAAFFGVMLLLCVPGVFAASVFSNISLNVSIDNNTGNVLVPGFTVVFDASENFSRNTSFLAACTIPDPVNRSLDLSRGEVKYVNGSFENLTLFCANETVLVNGTMCSVNRGLGRGERFELHGGSCDLNLFCDNNHLGNDTYQVVENVGVQKSGDLLILSIGNTSKQVSISLLNASDSIPVEFFCPKNFTDFSNDEEAALSFGYCQDMFPMLNMWLNLTLNKCVDNWDAYRDFVKTHNEQVIASNQALSDCRAASGGAEESARLKAARITELELELSKRDDRYDLAIWAAAFLVFVVLALILLCMFLLHRLSGSED